MSNSYRALGLICIIFTLLAQPVFAEPSYKPNHASVSSHPLPEWYQDAKFGVIISYGLYSVPGWAPLYNPSGKVFTPEFFFNNPYAEWYANTMQIKNSPTYRYHRATFGPNFKYDDFVPLFNSALQQWNPNQWADLFAKSGIKYVVMFTKHHDGFLLWPSQYPNPYKKNYTATRDVIGELTKAVRQNHMRMGLYYSGGFDWSFPDSDGNKPITSLIDVLKRVPQSQEYADYVDKQWHELINLYKPDIFWNDIALPQKVNKFKLFADYYNVMPEGVVSNRNGQGAPDFTFSAKQPADPLVDFQLSYDWFDFYDAEYMPNYQLVKHKWEADHGLGYSFAYNRQEYQHPAHLMHLDQLIADLANIVSKNGNLLLAISPKADGSFPIYAQVILLGMGEWLKQNGEAIYATRPWTQAEGSANNLQIPIRFTMSKDKKYLYAILLTNPQGKDIIINQFTTPVKTIEVLNGQNPISVSGKEANHNLLVFLSEQPNIPKQHPLVLKMML